MRAILITAGATRNPIDSMRYISANSSGRTGAWLAKQLSSVGSVTVLGSTEAICRCSDDTHTQEFTSTDDLMGKMSAWTQANPAGIIVHAAAVGDYQVKDHDEDAKLPSGQAELTLTMVPTPKILDAIRAWSDDVLVVSFKAAPPNTTRPNLERIADGQARRTDSAVVFANTIGSTDRHVLLWQNGKALWSEKRHDALVSLVQWISSQCS